MNEFNFSTPTAEGEYRAKQAKTKLPISNNFKKKNNKPQEVQAEAAVVEQPQNNQPVEIEVENPAQVAQENAKRDNKRKNNRKKFNKKTTENEIPTAETVLKPNEEIKPVVTEEKPVETEPAEKEAVKDEKPKRKRTATRKPRAKKSEAKVE